LRTFIQKKYNGKILTGVQSTGTPQEFIRRNHSCNQIINKPENESFLFIADLHSITQKKNRQRFELILTVQLQHGSLAD
jgi:tryptophanyl-tRNA synthetase